MKVQDFCDKNCGLLTVTAVVNELLVPTVSMSETTTLSHLLAQSNISLIEAIALRSNNDCGTSSKEIESGGLSGKASSSSHWLTGASMLACNRVHTSVTFRKGCRSHCGGPFENGPEVKRMTQRTD